jgi:hypothetical protein
VARYLLFARSDLVLFSCGTFYHQFRECQPPREVKSSLSETSIETPPSGDQGSRSGLYQQPPTVPAVRARAERLGWVMPRRAAVDVAAPRSGAGQWGFGGRLKIR